jgi:hypothetical protein
MSGKRKKQIYYFSNLFIGFLILYIFLYTIIPMNGVMNMIFWKLANYGLGMLAIVYFIVSGRCHERIRFYPLIFLFIISYIITIIANCHFGYIRSIQEIYYMIILFIIILSLCGQSDPALLRKQFVIFSSLILLILTPGMLYSIFMFVSGYSKTVSIGGRNVYQGFHNARLFGVFSDPNYAGMNAVAAIWISIAMLRFCRKRSVRMCICTGILIQFIYVILSNSRTAKIVFWITLAIGLWFCLKTKYRIRRAGAYILFRTGFLLAAIFIVWRITAVLLPASADMYADLAKKAEPVIQSVKPKAYDTYKPPAPEVSLAREDTEKEDFSNNRFSIWKSGMEVYSNHPFFGTGFTYMTDVGRADTPDTYIVQRGYSLHNGYLDILVSSGIAGFIAMMSLFLFLFVDIVNQIRRTGIEKADTYVVILLIPLSIAIGHLTLSGLCYSSTATTFLFWLYTGFSLKTSCGFLDAV